VKALGRPGRCGLLRERSRLARLRPVDAIRRGALSGAHALWSSGSGSNGPPSCGVLDEAGPGHGLGSPLRCQRVRVKFMRQHAVRVAGPDRIIFVYPTSWNQRSAHKPRKKILIFAFCSAILFGQPRACPGACRRCRCHTWIEAIMNPQKSDFRFVFQHIFRSSTTLVRVLSPSRRTKTLLEITGTI
jgi:hypothetical protein